MSEADQIRKKYKKKIRALILRNNEIDDKARIEKMVNLYKRKELKAEMDSKLRELRDKDS